MKRRQAIVAVAPSVGLAVAVAPRRGEAPAARPGLAFAVFPHDSVDSYAGSLNLGGTNADR